MSKPTILIVEDDGILAIHLEDLLTRQGYSVLKPVPTGEKAIRDVRKQKPDLVLMDIELAGEMNGITAAEQISAAADVPVIFLTGFSQDPLLQQAKIATPYGYLVKPVPERELAATIEMALYKHKLDYQVKVSEAKYRALIEQASDGIFLSNKSGDFLEVNSAGCSMLGYTHEEILNMNIRGIITPENLTAIPLRTKEMLYGAVLRYERVFIRKNGSHFPVEISGKMLENGNFQSIVRDITERKETERISQRNEIRLRSLLEITQYEAENIQQLLDFALEKAIQLTESKIGYIYFYDAAGQVFTLNSWSKEVMPECSIENQRNVIRLEETGFWGDAVRQRRTIVNNNFEAPHPQKKGTPEGHLVLTKFLTIPVIVNNAIVAVVGVANKSSDYDATDELQLSLMMDTVWKIVDQTKAEEKLRLESAALNAAANAIVITDQDGTIEWANQAFTNLTGYSLDEATGKNPRDLVKSGQHPPEFYRHMWETILAGQVWEGEMINRRKDGTFYNEEMTITPLRSQDGKIKQFIAIKQNITERKKAEEIRRHLEEKFTKVFQSSPDAITISLLKDGKYIEVNEGFCKISGFTHDEAVGKTTIELMIWPDPSQRTVFVQKLQENGEVSNFEIPLQTKSGEIITALVSARMMQIDGEPSIISVTRDISQRKQIEDALRYSEERYRLLFKEMAEGFALHEIILDENNKPVDYRFIDVNPAFEKLTGLNRENIIGRTVKEVLPQTEDYWIESYGQVALTGELIHYENYSEAIDKWFSVTAFSPKFGQFAVTFEDITESHKLNEVLHANEHMLNQIIEILPVGLWIADSKGKLIRSNPAGRKIWGAEPLVGQDDLGIFKACRLPSREKIAPGEWALAQTMNKGMTILNEMLEIEAFDNQKRIILNSSAPLKNDKDQVEGAVIVNLDITDWMLTEEALKQSQIHFQSLIENAPDGIALIDQNGKYKYVSPSGRKTFGYSADEYMDISPVSITHPDDLPALLEGLNNLIQKPAEKLSLQYRFRHKDGTYRWIASTFTNLLHEPSVEAIVINFRDITIRREAELKVQEQLDELRRWNAVTLGRENRILELKQEVNQLRSQAGLPPLYASHPTQEQNHD